MGAHLKEAAQGTRRRSVISKSSPSVSLCFSLLLFSFYFFPDIFLSLCLSLVLHESFLIQMLVESFVHPVAHCRPGPGQFRPGCEDTCTRGAILDCMGLGLA